MNIENIKDLIIKVSENTENIREYYGELVEEYNKKLLQLDFFLTDMDNFKELFDFLLSKVDKNAKISIANVTSAFMGRLVTLKIFETKNYEPVLTFHLDLKPLCRGDEKALKSKVKNYLKFDIDFDFLDFVEDEKFLNELRGYIKNLQNIEMSEIAKLLPLEKIQEYDNLMKLKEDMEYVFEALDKISLADIKINKFFKVLNKK